ncbi:MAG TPA: 2-oxoacid:acceptor oxidoreductase subunit alpha [Phycisphaerae bacterium]|nr:2-oxoacid:acceptor oxidoreductase subunit alpha [Phycisphaerae bacterium]
MVSTTTTNRKRSTRATVETLDSVAVRFAGDSGDGMQLTGTQFTNTSAILGNDLSTLPDFPAEIRAPAGSLGGVSGFQINFSAKTVHTPGDRLHALIAMNPAALKTNLADLEHGGILVVNADAFTQANLTKAGYEANPLEDGSLQNYRLHALPIERLNNDALADTGLNNKAANRCKNFFALGLVYWLYSRPLEPTLRWIEAKFARRAAIADANSKVLRAGYYYGETAEIFPVTYRVERAAIAPGRYRKVTGNEATAMGLIAAARRADTGLFYASYPITPASEILQELSRRKNYGVKTFQAEDEIAAICVAIGASFAGQLAVTGTSGPGLALKGEAIGLAVMTELPLVIVNVQRGGPSTGLPTKTEQADLLQAVYGRHGECPLPVLAASTPQNCFHMAVEAFRIATKYMTPVILLSDGYLANGAEPWRIPNVDDLPEIRIEHPTDPATFQPYQRNEHLARPWAIPGTPGLQHRIGGLEKQDVTGNVCYEPDNHEKMVGLRAAKVAKVADDIPLQAVVGDETGELLVVSWGSTYGATVTAVERCRERGLSVSLAHLHYIEPFPRNLGDLLKGYKRILVPELNRGQLATKLRAAFLVETIQLNKVQGKPFKIHEIEEKIEQVLAGMNK